MNNNCNLADPIIYPLLLEDAKRMKAHPTESENVFWNLVRGRQLGVVFRRQYVIDQYIVDFVALKKRLVVEIDGGYHELPNQQLWDEMRTRVLNRMGFEVLRFTNEEVLLDTDNVIAKVKAKMGYEMV